MHHHEAIKFLESLKRQAEYRRTQLNADPVVAREASMIEGYIRDRLAAIGPDATTQKRTRKLQRV